MHFTKNLVEEFACNLEGAWKLTRRIFPSYRSVGSGIFTAESPSVLRFRETGTLAGFGMQNEFYRSYRYLFDIKNGVLIIKHSEGVDVGKILHEFVIPSTSNFPLILTHEHSCIDDRYFVKFKIKSENAFSILYKVTGPKKNYKMISHYRKGL